MASLAAHLRHLDKNDVEYLSYFWWRRYYHPAPARLGGTALGMCELCRMLNDPNQPDKVLDDVEEWWWKGGKCKNFPKWITD